MNPSTDKIFDGYVECALWSSMDNSNEQGGEPLDRNYTRNDIAKSALLKMRADVDAFYEANRADCDTCVSPRPSEWSADEQIGHDLWLSRNGHGAGFFDAYKGTPYSDDVADRLQEAARKLGEQDLYVGDDGQIYVN